MTGSLSGSDAVMRSAITGESKPRTYSSIAVSSLGAVSPLIPATATTHRSPSAGSAMASRLVAGSPITAAALQSRVGRSDRWNVLLT